MSNNQSQNTPKFGSEEYYRILAGIRVGDNTPNSQQSPDFFSPPRVNNVNRYIVLVVSF